ncbi:hypothetical protein LTR78_010594 [Recurvomyces mirabilis]|uniref:Ankyrin n=1 Tax=Recurvomyces mirabilis TaxID=574656 RepID=A0AAE0TLQ0_9PEZI|nr:hypothetical protein LTR78_010594 [Recurvomyces mirabilis]KAK5150138.1 hypothetical protein LTS14_010401 [Recurvomyces mirabilis]
MTGPALCRFPSEILSTIFVQVINYVGIRLSVRLRLVCHKFDQHIQDAIFSLPTFESPDAVAPGHLTWDWKMGRAMIASLIHNKLESHQDERALTREILCTADFVATVLGETNREAYKDALVELAVAGLPLHQVLHGLIRDPQLLTGRSSAIENALIASLYMGRGYEMEVWILKGACAGHRTKWFGDALTVACCYADVEMFRSIIRVVSMTDDTLKGDAAASRMVMALESGAASGRLDIFSPGVCYDTQVFGTRYGIDEFLKPALKSAALKSHDDVVIAIMSLMKQHDLDASTTLDQQFWDDLLRIAASNGSDIMIRVMLSYPSLVGSSRAFDLALEDACRNGHFSVAELLTATASDHSLRYGGATYWAARNSRHDILRLLFESAAGAPTSYLVDALCGGAVHGYPGLLSVLVSAGLQDIARAYDKHAPRTFTDIVDDVCKAGLLKDLKVDSVEVPEKSDSSEFAEDIFNDLMSVEQVQLERACSKGDFPAVSRILANTAITISQATFFLAGFSESIRQERPGMVQYLCEKLAGQPTFVAEAIVRVRSTAVLQVLLDKGWSTEAFSSRLKPPILRSMVRSEEMTRWLLDHRANPNTRCDLDITPLSVAVQSASLTTIRLLLESGGDTRKGQPLHFAIERDQLDQLAIIDMLIACGAAIDARMFENDPASWLESRLLGAGTSLHKAAELGRTVTVAHLLREGADATVVDSIGRTALDIAEAKRHNEVIKVLNTRSLG